MSVSVKSILAFFAIVIAYIMIFSAFLNAGMPVYPAMALALGIMFSLYGMYKSARKKGIFS